VRSVVIANSTTEYVLRFRQPLLAALRHAGMEPVVVAPADGTEGELSRLGYEHRPLVLESAGTDPFRELRTLRQLLGHYRALRPALALHFTPKLNIYGGLAARWLDITAINNLSGMGTAFIRGGILGFVAKQLMRVSQRSAAHVFVQNPDDERFAREAGIARPEQLSILPGSGIDLEQFPFTPMSADSEGPVHFVLIARLAVEKGVIEFMAAARHLLDSGLSARFSIAGDIPTGTGVDPRMVTTWAQAPGRTWLGKVEDVDTLIAESDCVVLPSYREGTPRVLLEAAAMGRPVIAADTIGTREPLIPGETGLLCAPRDCHDLARVMKRMVELGHDARATMGMAGRRFMEEKYDVRFVVEAYQARIHEVLVDGEMSGKVPR
jgi:glycosyltransferase involved in cell wall biosynthesis